MQAGQKALGLLLDTGRGWQGQQQGGQLLSCILVSLLTQQTAGSPTTNPAESVPNALSDPALPLLPC